MSTRAVLDAATARNAELGHENLGSLSSARGYLPAVDPLLSFPSSHAAWDDTVAQMPELYASLRVRAHLDALPDLDGSVASLPDAYLLRAASVLGLLTHAYHRVQPWSPAETPPHLHRAWVQVNERLGRPEPFLGYGDLILYNWQNPTGGELLVETMQLLVPTAGNKEEHTFHLTQVEMHAVGAPVIAISTRIEDAVREGDNTLLAALLDAVGETMTGLIRQSLPKIDPNPAARTHVDQGIWAKTVAPLAVPIQTGVLGPSGTSAPLFHTLDALFGRKRYDSVLGHETMKLRAIFPLHWQQFVSAVSAIRLPDYVQGTEDRELRAAYAKASELYYGADGILERHRLKVAGYIEMGFKLGRNVTIGGFSGRFSDRTWREIDEQLVASRDDRFDKVPSHTHRARVLRTSSASEVEAARVRQVVLDTAGTGLNHAAGDRCLVYPEQDSTLVERTLRAMGARGDEPIRLDVAWQDRMETLGDPRTELAVGELLLRGELRPVSRAVAKTLLDLCASERLEGIIEARAEDQWELPDILAMLAERGWDPGILLTGEPGDRTSLCRVVPPVVARVYSLSSHPAQHRDELHLTIGSLGYRAGDGDAAMHGTGSWFLTRGDAERQVALSVRRSAAFAPPDDPATPIIMVAGGSGISPFRAFLEHRHRTSAPGECILLLGVRDSSELYYKEELERLADLLALTVCVVFSREDADVEAVKVDGSTRLQVVPGKGRRMGDRMLEPDMSDALWRLMRDRADGGEEAILYVCGAAGFSSGIDGALRQVFQQHGDSPEQADHRFRRLSAARRYVAEVFTTYTGPQAAIARQIDASELATHTSASPNPWLAVRGRVYDMTEFKLLHPGGDILIDGYAGTDATAAYEHVRHHHHAEVDALLSMYEIGAMRRLDLGRAWGTMVGTDGLEVVELTDLFTSWVRLLYLAVEMHNAARTDVDIRRKQVTRDSAVGERTAYALQFCIEAHERFVLNNRELVDEPVARLWAMVTGLCDQRRDVRELPTRIAEALATAEVVAADAAGTVLYAELQRVVDEADADGIVALDGVVGAVVNADGWLQAKLEEVLRDGIRELETHQATAVERAGQRLEEILTGIPALLREHAVRVDSAVRGLPVHG